jgi:hypothetical protein
VGAFGASLPVVDLAQVGVEYQVENGADVVLAEPGQLGTLGVRRAHQPHADVLDDRDGVGRVPVGVPVRDLDREVAQLLVPGCGGFEHDPGQQIGFFSRVRRQPEPGAVPEALGRAPQVEGGGAGGDPHRPAGGVLRGKRAGAVQEHVDHVTFDLEPPRLGVVHARRGHGRREQDVDVFRRQLIGHRRLLPLVLRLQVRRWEAAALRARVPTWKAVSQLEP